MKNYTFRYEFETIKRERDLLLDKMEQLCLKRNFMHTPKFESAKNSLKVFISRTVQLDSAYCLTDASEGADITNKKYLEYFTEFKNDNARLLFNLTFNELLNENKRFLNLSHRIKRLEEQKNKSKSSKYDKLLKLQAEIRKDEENEFPFRKY